MPKFAARAKDTTSAIAFEYDTERFFQYFLQDEWTILFRIYEAENFLGLRNVCRSLKRRRMASPL